MLKVAAILEESIVDGPGIRSVIFFQGCPRHCEGCHNPDLLPFEGGTEYSPQQLADEVFPKLTPLHRGITLSGRCGSFRDDDHILALYERCKRRGTYRACGSVQ